jgi:branched-chain amino acid transport system substrate-binding protein
MNYTKFKKFPLLAIFFSFLSASHLIAQSKAELIKIVSSLPRTGSSNAQSSSIVNGIKLAIEARGGKIDGVVISYQDLDDASPERGTWDPALEAANADKAAKDQDVFGYIGPYNSGAAKISMPILNKARLAMVSPGNTYPGLTKLGFGEANEPAVYRPSGTINYFRVVPSDDLQGAIAAKWAKELGSKRIFIVHDRELYGRGIADVFKSSSAKFNLEIVGFEGIDPKSSNFKALATKIRSSQADAIFFGGTTQTGAPQLVKDIRSSGVKATFIAPDGCFENAFIEAAGKHNLEGNSYITFGGVPASQLTGKGAQFAALYEKRFSEPPQAYAVYGYEAANVLLNAIQQALSSPQGLTREVVIEKLKEVKNYQGALGNWSFDENGDTTLTTMSVNNIKSGKFNFITLLGLE